MNSTLAQLRDTAFGLIPDRLATDVVARAERADHGTARWFAAVVLGAQGHYGRASAALAPLISGPDRVLASLASSTYAAHRRQLGGHAAARRWDGRALALLASTPPSARRAVDLDGVDFAGAAVDALLGLAADALALGRQREARALLNRVPSGFLGVPLLSGWRARVRHGWVRAEVELAAGDPASAREPAERAAALAEEYGAVRHQVKSDIVLAAVLAATRAEPGRVADLLERALVVARRHGLASLIWPAELIAADVDTAGSPAHRDAADRCLHAVLRRSDPPGRILALESPWVPIFQVAATKLGAESALPRHHAQ